LSKKLQKDDIVIVSTKSLITDACVHPCDNAQHRASFKAVVIKSLCGRHCQSYKLLITTALKEPLCCGLSHGWIQASV